MAAPNAVPVTGQKKSQISFPMICALIVVVGVAVYLNLPNQNATDTSAKHRDKTTTTTTSADINGITAADYSAHFPRYPGTGRNPYVPGILSASQQNADASGLLGGKGSAAGGSWSLTGVTIINGVASALVESAAGDSVTLKKGDEWHGLKVASIGSDAVTFTNELGQTTHLGFDSGTANKNANPGVPSLSQIQPLAPLSVSSASTGSSQISVLPAITTVTTAAPNNFRSRRRNRNFNSDNTDQSGGGAPQPQAGESANQVVVQIPGT